MLRTLMDTKNFHGCLNLEGLCCYTLSLKLVEFLGGFLSLVDLTVDESQDLWGVESRDEHRRGQGLVEPPTLKT